MQTLLTRVIAILLALQPWAFGMFAAPRSKNNSASSLSSPAQDQTILENNRTVVQVQNAAREMGVVPKITAFQGTPRFYMVSNYLITSTEARHDDVLARFSRWNE